MLLDQPARNILVIEMEGSAHFVSGPKHYDPLGNPPPIDTLQFYPLLNVIHHANLLSVV